jgi:acyl dehydratase
MALNVGDGAEVSKTITDADVRAFAELTGDRNPVLSRGGGGGAAVIQ